MQNFLKEKDNIKCANMYILCSKNLLIVYKQTQSSLNTVQYNSYT